MHLNLIYVGVTCPCDLQTREDNVLVHSSISLGETTKKILNQDFITNGSDMSSERYELSEALDGTILPYIPMFTHMFSQNSCIKKIESSYFELDVLQNIVVIMHYISVYLPVSCCFACKKGI